MATEEFPMPASPKHQLSLELIPHQVNKVVIGQRASDGYINATEMCKTVPGKMIADYMRLNSTKEFLAELASDMGIPISDLVQVVKGGPPLLQGTWVHPDVAINLALWVSPKFAVLVAKWVREWLSGNQPRSATMPYHLRRHMLNLHKIPPTHFSILQEMTNTLIAPLESHGYTMPDKLMPDISQGLTWCKHARENLGVDTDALPTYAHEFENRKTVVDAKLYPIELLADFRRFINEVWLKERASGYFKERDPVALPYLDKILKLVYEVPKALPLNKPKLKKKA